MKIEINPKSLLNLENIFEVLYKLHPYVLDELVEMERNLGGKLILILIISKCKKITHRFTGVDLTPRFTGSGIRLN